MDREAQLAETLFNYVWEIGLVKVEHDGYTREELFAALELLRERITLTTQAERTLNA